MTVGDAPHRALQVGSSGHPRSPAMLTLTLFFFFNDTATTEIYTLSLHDALPISCRDHRQPELLDDAAGPGPDGAARRRRARAGDRRYLPVGVGHRRRRAG